MRGTQPPLLVCIYGVDFKVQDIFAFSVPNTSEWNATFQERETNFISKTLGSVQKNRKRKKLSNPGCCVVKYESQVMEHFYCLF